MSLKAKAKPRPAPNQDERLWLAELEARMDECEASYVETAEAIVESLCAVLEWRENTATFWQRLRWVLFGG